ncbi:putative porin [Ferruginibacter lapsinanis]|uniref:putative porin n=1 Tax=Ferruginibacter lapsinanis TaxID=563172 RepID=UPI001E2F8846|nr:putative porin [Ferruginibacter lapsinanis]UEG49702.1 putative porin [Ferruginibacter lapsinanis]
MKKLLLTLFIVIAYTFSYAQIGRVFDKLGADGPRRGRNTTGTTDTSGGRTGLGFEHRDDAKDSITISFKYIDGIKSNRIDSSINDFYNYFSVPAAQQYLGNNGSAGYSLIYTPFTKAGWDAGFHAYDAYRYTLDNSRFFKTTKPFTQMSYQLASGKEQMIKILHTQNPMPNLNFGFEYKLITAPGFFVTQNTSHNSYRIFSNYQGKRKRYAAYFMLMGNTLKGSENGGIKNDSFLLSPNFSKRFTIPVNLGRDSGSLPNPFNSSVTTGNIYKDFTFFLRQSYDIGKKDSIIINDSTTEYLFYSKLRFQHTLTYSSYNYQFKDVEADSGIYKRWYDTTLKKFTDSLIVTDRWKVVTNDFSLMQFPDTKNSAQYLLAGARLENITGTFSGGSKNFYNIVLHGEYRNKTRNRLWDILVNGEFYLNGLNSGDYSANAMLERFLNKKWGNVKLSFSNVNRSPSFIYNTLSSFNFGNTASYKKENITVAKVSADNPFISLSAANYFITNYIYFTNYYQTAQYSKVINLIQASASKKIKLSKRWSWYADITLQQTDAAAPIKVPFIFTRNRIAYEGVFYKNLNLSTGLELRYYTPFKAYNYSPVMGQFMPQDTLTIKNRPDIAAFLHFRIKSFTGFLRAENLNAIDFTNGFGFTKNNFAAPHYVYQGFIFRFGIRWNFVN